MRVVAIIPARGGSVGLPRKNVKPFNGIPLVGRSVLAAKAAACVDEVYVSSDSAEILDVAAKYGAIGIPRPDDISTGTASSESAIVHALEWMQSDLKAGLPDVVIFLQCTSPFTSAEDIVRVHAALIEGDTQAAFSVVEDHGFIWAMDEHGYATGVTHDHRLPRLRRQDMQPRYRETGAIYAMKTDAFLASGTRFCGKTRIVECAAPPIEIDTEEDWRLAEAIASSVLSSADVTAKLKHSIKALVTDFDGVHTDDLLIQFADGTEGVSCSRSDGMGIELLREQGLELLVLSKEENNVVAARAKKLKMEVQHHVLDKRAALDTWRQNKQINWSEICYIGNDINDIECLEKCGLAVVPADAHPQAKAVAALVLQRSGGRGALRELSEVLIARHLIARP